MSLRDFFAMGGYAAYVWPAYAVFFAVLLADYLAPIVRRRQVLRELRSRLARQKARKDRHVHGTAESSQRRRPESRVPSPESRS